MPAGVRSMAGAKLPPAGRRAACTIELADAARVVPHHERVARGVDRDVAEVARWPAADRLAARREASAGRIAPQPARCQCPRRSRRRHVATMSPAALIASLTEVAVPAGRHGRSASAEKRAARRSGSRPARSCRETSASQPGHDRVAGVVHGDRPGRPADPPSVGQVDRASAKASAARGTRRGLHDGIGAVDLAPHRDRARRRGSSQSCGGDALASAVREIVARSPKPPPAGA